MGSHAAGVHGGQGGEHSSHLERALGSANKVIHRALEGMCIKSPSGDVSDGDEIIMDPSSSDPEDALRRRLADQQRQSATPPPADSFPHDPAAKQGGSDGVYNLLEAMTCGRDELKQLASEAKAELKQPRRIHSEGAVRPIGGPVSIDEDSIQRKEAVADLARVLVEMRGAWVPSHRRELERLAEPPTLTRSCYMSHILTSMRLIDVQEEQDDGGRISRAVPHPDGQPEDWTRLVRLVESEKLGGSGDDDELLVEVNSGGKVFFGLLTQEHSQHEAAVCIKFGTDKLGTQSEFLAYELAALLGVRSPSCRLIRKGQPEWVSLREAAERLASPASTVKGAAEQDEGSLSAEELLSWMKRARCLLLVGFVPGSALGSSATAFDPSPHLDATAEELGRVFLLDMVLCNPDRMACQTLGWRGNPNNIRCSPSTAGEGKGSGPPQVVTIDHTLARRPPRSVVCNESSCVALCKLLMQSPGEAGKLLDEVVHGLAGPAQATSLAPAGAAFLKGFQEAMAKLRIAAGGLEMIRGRMDDLTRVFFRSLGVGEEDDESAEVPTTMKLRQVQQQAKLDNSFWERFSQCEVQLKEQLGEVQGSVDMWREQCGVASPLTTGFLDSAQPLVQAYELKVRLQHMLERAKPMLEVAEAKSELWEPVPGTHQTSTDTPVMVYPGLFIGGMLAAASKENLQAAGITYILNATGGMENSFPGDFEYLNIDLDDMPEAAEALSSSWEDASDFIDNALSKGSNVLVHCFEGRSRSASLILAYLVSRRQLLLRDALHMLKTAHPPTRPNYGFMNSLRELDHTVHGKASTRPVRKPAKPETKVCPVCAKDVGISSRTLTAHIKKHHHDHCTHSQTKLSPFAGRNAAA